MQVCKCEFLRRHGFCKQEALDHVKVHFADREEVGAALHALGDRATAKAVGDIEYLPARGPLQPVVGTAGNELTIDFDLDKGEVFQPDKRETFRPETVDRNCYVAESNLPSNRSCQAEIGNDIRGADFDDKPTKCRVIWQPAAKIRDRIRVPEKVERQIDSDLHGALLRGEVMPVFDRLVREGGKVFEELATPRAASGLYTRSARPCECSSSM
jgi:hypothetical protein